MSTAGGGPPDVVLGTALADDVAGYQAFTRRAVELGFGRVWLTERPTSSTRWPSRAGRRRPYRGTPSGWA